MAEKVVNHKGEESSGTRVWCVETTRLRRERGERERGGKGAFYFEDVVKEQQYLKKRAFDAMCTALSFYPS